MYLGRKGDYLFASDSPTQDDYVMNSSTTPLRPGLQLRRFSEFVRHSIYRGRFGSQGRQFRIIGGGNLEVRNHWPKCTYALPQRSRREGQMGEDSAIPVSVPAGSLWS